MKLREYEGGILEKKEWYWRKKEMDGRENESLGEKCKRERID